MKLNSTFTTELKHHYLFKELSDEVFLSILNHSHLRTIDKKRVLFFKGDLAKHFFMVRSGKIMLYQTSPEGDEKVIEIVEPGHTFAEAVMFMENHQYPINARALSKTELFYFDNQEFISQLEKSPTLCFKLMADMSIRLRSMVYDISQLTIYDAQHRIISYFLGKITDDEMKEKINPSIQLSVSKAILSSRLSITPETFSRTLSKLKKEGLIKIDGDIITLIQPEKLKKLIGET